MSTLPDNTKLKDWNCRKALKKKWRRDLKRPAKKKTMTMKARARAWNWPKKQKGLKGPAPRCAPLTALPATNSAPSAAAATAVDLAALDAVCAAGHRVFNHSATFPLFLIC